jgi:hypothetical protein
LPHCISHFPYFGIGPENIPKPWWPWWYSKIEQCQQIRSSQLPGPMGLQGRWRSASQRAE